MPGNAPTTIMLPVHANDRIYAKLTVINPWKVRFFIKNVTSGGATSFDWDFSTLPSAVVEGLTAEWIVERPTDVVTGDRFTLRISDGHNTTMPCDRRDRHRRT